MMTDQEIYDSMIQEKGLAYKSSQVLGPGRTHYGDPIDNSPGRLAGNSHIWGTKRGRSTFPKNML